MTLCVVYLLQIRIIANLLDTFLQRNHFIIAGHYHNRAELQPFSEVHCADRRVVAHNIDILIQNLEGDSGFFDCCLCAW
jgi:hypothetical protein